MLNWSDDLKARARHVADLTSRMTHRNCLAVGLVSYFVAGLITLVIARTLAGGPTDVRQPLVVLALGCVIPIALARFDPWRVLRALFAIVLLGTLTAIWFDALPERPYGDGGFIADFLPRAYVFPRWMLGMALAVALYKGFWTSPPVVAYLPARLATPGTFAALLCSTVMGISSIAILTRWRTLPVVFAVLTPVWMLFSTGYVEYYPLMVGAWLAALAWIFERPLSERDALFVGGLAGIMPAIYIGFTGFSVILFLVYAIARPGRALPALGAAAASLALSISTSYPTIAQYIQQLYSEMNFGAEHLSFFRYARHSAGPHSIFFTTRYAFAPSHLGDVAYMLFWSGGWMFLPVGLAALLAMSKKREQLRTAMTDARMWLAIGLASWQVYYLLFMIPLAGPTRDVDLFCPTFILLAFTAGLLVEQSTTNRRVRHGILCAIVGTDVVTAVFLAWIGLPSRL